MEGVGRKIQWSVPPQFKNILFYILNLWYHCNFKQVLYTMLTTLAGCGSAVSHTFVKNIENPQVFGNVSLQCFPRTPKSFFKCVREFESRILRRQKPSLLSRAYLLHIILCRRRIFYSKNNKTEIR